LVKNVEVIYEEIKSRIINLDYLPGMKIKEEDLAKDFNASRTPIREVISRLVKDSLLIVAPKKGTYVSKIDISNINDYIYVRKEVEKSIIAKLVNEISDEQIKELEEILKEQQIIMEMEPSIVKSKKFFHNDNAFHAALFRFAGAEGVWKIIHTNAIPLNRARIMANLRTNPQVNEIYKQHLQMLESIKQKDKKKAIESFSNHLDGGFEGINELVKKYNEYFV
jgi:DNA-binding GntR family transcriptional regulator